MENKQMGMDDIADIQEYKSHNRLLQKTDVIDGSIACKGKVRPYLFGLVPFAVLIAILVYYFFTFGDTKVQAADNNAVQNEASADAAEKIAEEASNNFENISDLIATGNTTANDTDVTAKNSVGWEEESEIELSDDIVVAGAASQAFAFASSDPNYTSTADTEEIDDSDMETEDSIIGIQFEDSTPDEVRWKLIQEQMTENAEKLMISMGISVDYSSKDPALPEYLIKTYNPDMVMSLSEEELDALLTLVEAEAPAEDIYGKILVANVVLNRVLSDEAADTVLGVIYQKIGGSAQFSSTTMSWYWNSIEVTDSTREAVARALSGEDYSQGAMYFYAWKTVSNSKSRWFNENTVYLFTHGGHKMYASKEN